MFKSMLLSFSLLMAFSVQAENHGMSEEESYFTISEVEVREVSTPNSEILRTLSPEVNASIGEIAVVIDGLIAIGKKIWPIIEAGRPVVDTTGLITAHSVLPYVASEDPRGTLLRMSRWSRPKVVSYKVSYKNGHGSEVISFIYTIYFQHNGQYEGKGKYLTSITTEASEVYTAWGFDFNAQSELASIANVGTDESPVASAILKISYKAKSFLNEIQNSHSIYLDGAGIVESLKK